MSAFKRRVTFFFGTASIVFLGSLIPAGSNIFVLYGFDRILRQFSVPLRLTKMAGGGGEVNNSDELRVRAVFIPP